MSKGPANESGQALTFSVSNDNLGLFSSAPAVSPTSGDLTYTPAADANGSATVTVLLTDDGGTANGGDDTSAGQTFTITVNAVNDAPSFTKGADQTVDEDAGAQSVSNWASAISKGPADESAQTLSFTSSNDNNALFSVQPGVTPTGTLVFTTAPNKHGSATVTVSLSDTGGTANGGDDTSDSQTFTITVDAVNDAPVAAAKAFTVQANMKLSLGGLLVGASDTADTAQNPGYTPTFTVGSITAGAGCIGCTVSNVDNANGTFDLDPPAGGTGTYTLDYTVVDTGDPAPGATSAPQTITLTVNGPVVWFVDGSAAPGGTGRLSAPFQTLAAAAAVDGTGHRVFVAPGTYADGITLTTSEWLLGSGTKAASFDSAMGFSPPAGTIARPAVNTTAPTIQGTVVLGSDNPVRGATLSGSPALSGSGFGTLALSSGGAADLALSSTGQALSLTNGTISGDLLSTTSSGGTNNVLLSGITSSGTSLGSGALSGSSGEGFKVVGGTGVLSYGGSIANAGTATVSVSSKTAGSVTLTGAISDTAGPGVALAGNTGSTITFSGSVALSSGSSPAFAATGGGTVVVTGSTNTLASTTGTALTVTDTTIGSSGLTFRSISSNGAARGIHLSNTGSSGGLTVTGNGGTCTAANTAGCSGGTIANATGADDASSTPAGTGIVLNSTRNVSLTRMLLSGSSNYGVRGTSVVNLTMADSVVNGTHGTNDGGPYYDGGLRFDGLTGTASLARVAVSGGYGSNIDVSNSSGTLNATFDALTVGANSTAGGNDGLQVEGIGSAAVNATLTNSTFTSSRGDLVQYIADGSGGGSLTMTGNTLSNNHPGIATGGGGVSLTGGAAGPVTMTISNNTSRDAVGHAWLIVKNLGTGSITGTFDGNTIGASGVANSGSLEGDGLKLQQAGNGAMSFAVTNNTVRQYNNQGIGLQAGAGVVAGGTFAVTNLSGNTVTQPGTNAAIDSPFQGIHLNNGVTPGDSFTACVNFGANSINGSGRNGGTDFRVRQRQDTTVRLPGYAGSAGDTTAVVTFIQGKIGGTPSGSAAVSGTGGGFVGTAC